MKLKNIDRIAERIKLAVKNGERIIVYGDSDLDGIASVTILEEAIEIFGGKVEVTCFPNREMDGYGINLKALAFLKDKAPALFIALDLGIGNVKEVDEANKLGFEVIIVDHHLPLAELPRASLIMNPLQPGDDYPFKGLANVGLTYNLALELLEDKITPAVKNGFLELAALATISDMVPQIEQNKEFIDQGLRSLASTQRPGLKAFLQILSYKKGEDITTSIISALNAAESVDFVNRGHKMLRSSSLEESKLVAEELLGKVAYKQQQVKSITDEVERRMNSRPEEPIIFEGDPSWKLILAGSVASALIRKYNKPVFIFKKMDTESTGSVRCPKGLDSVAAMRTCADLLITFGGHAPASGFRLKNENLEEYKRRLIEYFSK